MEKEEIIKRIIEIQILLKGKGDVATVAELDKVVNDLEATTRKANKATFDLKDNIDKLDGNLKKAAKSVIEIKERLETFSKFAKIATGAYAAYVGMLNQSIPSFAGLIKQGFDLNKSLLTLSISMSKYGIGITEVENKVKKWSSQMNVSKAALYDMTKTYEVGFRNVSLEGAENLFKRLHGVFGSNTEALKEAQTALTGLIAKYPELESSIASVDEATIKNNASLNRSLVLTGKMSLAEAKRINDYLNGNKQKKAEDEAATKKIKEQQEMTERMTVAMENLSQSIADGVTGPLSKLSEWLSSGIGLMTQFGGVIAIAGMALPGLVSGAKMFGSAIEWLSRKKIAATMAECAAEKACDAAGITDVGGKGKLGKFAKARASLNAGMAGRGGLLKGATGAAVGTAVGYGTGLLVGEGYEALTGKNLDKDYGADAYAGSIGRVGARGAAGFATGGVPGAIGSLGLGIASDSGAAIRAGLDTYNQYKAIEEQKKKIASMRGAGGKTAEEGMSTEWEKTRKQKKDALDKAQELYDKTWFFSSKEEEAVKKAREELFKYNEEFTKHSKEIEKASGYASLNIEENKVGTAAKPEKEMPSIFKIKAALQIGDLKTANEEREKALKAGMDLTEIENDVLGAYDAQRLKLESQKELTESILSIEKERISVASMSGGLSGEALNKSLKEQLNSIDEQVKMTEKSVESAKEEYEMRKKTYEVQADQVSKKYGIARDKDGKFNTGQMTEKIAEQLAKGTTEGTQEADKLRSIYNSINDVQTAENAIKAASNKLEEEILNSVRKKYDAIKNGIESNLASQKELNEATTSQQEILINIADNMGAGLKASVQQRVALVASIQEQINLNNTQQQQFKNAINDASLDEQVRVQAAADLKKLENEKLQLMQKQVEVTKELREGYVDAIRAMTQGTGMFTKIMVDQDKNLGFAVRTSMTLGGMKAGGMRSDMGAAGYRSASQFGLGGMQYGLNGQQQDMQSGTNPAIMAMVNQVNTQVQSQMNQLSQKSSNNAAQGVSYGANTLGAGALRGAVTGQNAPPANMNVGGVTINIDRLALDNMGKELVNAIINGMRERGINFGNAP